MPIDGEKMKTSHLIFLYTFLKNCLHSNLLSSLSVHSSSNRGEFSFSENFLFDFIIFLNTRS
jgi:hypothetical protein